MAEKVVHVTVGEDSISVDPETIHMRREDRLRWVGKNPKRFAVVFEKDSPFDEVEIDDEKVKRSQQPRRNAEFMKYKYTVISTENPSVMLDPLVIIDPPDTNPDGG
ncbi:MAG: hypothetical protein HKN21_05135 [Candidatus Eisenbacteria bacterium]|uniref:Uncharacterized protein n=1 Tax=Eiseniibacteriota bacterium TaxID=2212470 RepID=A0A7Y2H1K2_UNCEI|nr:hypothetical protein [Candidatus Eisenbacteria bacterium]